MSSGPSIRDALNSAYDGSVDTDSWDSGNSSGSSLRDTLRENFEQSDDYRPTPARDDSDKTSVRSLLREAYQDHTGEYVPHGDVDDETPPRTVRDELLDSAFIAGVSDEDSWSAKDKAEAQRPDTEKGPDVREALERATEKAQPSTRPVEEVIAGWSQADRAMLARQPADVQQWLHEKTETAAPYLKIEEVGRDYFAEHGLTPAHAVVNLLNADYVLRHGSQQEKLAIIQDAIRSYGLRDISLDGQAAPHGDGGQRARLAEINAKNEKDGRGNALRPNFDALGPKMMQIEAAARRQGWQPTLQQIYDAASGAKAAAPSVGQSLRMNYARHR